MAREGQSISRWPLVAMGLVGVAAAVGLVVSMGGKGFSPSSSSDGRKRKVLDGASTARLVDPRTRLEEARRLGEKRVPEAVPLLRRFADDRDPEVRLACVWALGEIGDQDAVSAIRVRVYDKDIRVRVEAAKALGKLYNTPADQGLRELLTDEHVNVRVAAAEALGGITGDERAAKTLLVVLADLNPQVRVAAVKALAKMPGKLAAEGLAKGLADRDASVRSAAREAVRLIGKQIVPHLEAALAAADSIEARMEAARLLGEMGDVGGAPALLRLVDRSGGDAQVPEKLRTVVTEALASMGPPVLAVLYERVIDGECGPIGQDVAAEVCRRVGKPAVEPISRAILRWKLFPDPQELKLWVKVLGEIGDPAAAAALNRALSQDIEGMAAVVDEARKKIEAKSGAKLPPAEPDLDILLGKPSPLALQRVRTGQVAITPGDPQPGPIPDNGVVRLFLKGAIVLPSNKKDRSDAELELVRRDGKWDEACKLFAPYFNKRYHNGRLVKHSMGEKVNLHVEVIYHDDPYRKGAYGEYEIEFDPKKEGVSGSYKGHSNHEEVSSDQVFATVWPQAWPAPTVPPLESGEHPRMLFRKQDLPKLRQRVRTDFGRSVIRAIRSRIARSKRLYAQPVEWVTNWQPGIDAAIGHALLAMLFDDAPHGRRAAVLVEGRTKVPPYGGEHGERLPEPMSHFPFACDLARPYLTPKQWASAEDALGARFISYTLDWGGSGIMATSRGVLAVPGTLALALLREKGPFNMNQPPAPAAFLALEPDKSIGPHAGVPVNAFESGRMVTKWLIIGPFDTPEPDDPLASLGGAAEAQPQVGASVPAGKLNLTFLPLTAVVAQIPGQQAEGEYIKLPSAGPESRTFLYALLEVKGRKGGYLDQYFSLGQRFANIWINGKKMQPGSVVMLEEGTHRVMVEAKGEHVSPYFTPVNAKFAKAVEKKHEFLTARYQAARKRHEQTGEVQDIPLKFEMCRTAVRTALHLGIADARQTGRYGGGGWAMPFMFACWTATGQAFVPDTPLPVEAFPHMISSGDLGAEDVCFGLALAPEALKPALLWEFNRRYLPGKLADLSCRELVGALVSYPFDLKPQHPDEIVGKTAEHRGSGAYDFRSDDFLTHVFLRARWARHPTGALPAAGSFSLIGFDMAWAIHSGLGRASKFENVLDIEGSPGTGLGKLLYFNPRPDGSGTLGADMSGAYNHPTDAGIRASRHFAVDYGKRSGAPVLVAVADRVDGGGLKSWRLHPLLEQGMAAAGEGRTFTITRAGRGGTYALRGLVVAPKEMRLRVSDASLIRKPPVYRIEVVTEARQADFFIVMTVSKEAAPKITVKGEGLNAVVQVGGQEIRFDGKQLILKH